MPANTLKKFLDSRGVKYVSIQHSLAFTAPEVAASAHIAGSDFAKTVIVKIDGRMAMVVVPAIMHSTGPVARLVDDLEVRFLGNREDNLHFALLTDFADASAASLPADADLLASARAGIHALNARYGAGRFFLFHRERLERERDALDGMGAQARQAGRAQRAAQGRDRYQFRRHGW